MTISAFLAYVVALAIAVAIPGPGIAALVGRALGTGARRTMPMLFGLALGDVVFLTLAVAGLALVAKSFSTLFLVIKLMGAAYLLYLAYRFWTSGIEIQDVKKASGRREGLASMMAGFAVTIGNPKTLVFYMAILPAVMDLTTVDITGYLVLVALTFLVLFVVLTPYVLLAERARSFLKDPAHLRLLNRFAATAMTGTAAWIVARG